MTFKLIPETNQEAFDMAVRHMANQKHRSMSETYRRCSYFEPNGDRCAYGALHSPENAQELERRCGGMAVRELEYVEYESFDPDVEGALVDHGDVALGLLEGLQEAHDMNTTPISLRLYLKGIAERFDLDPSAVELITEWSGT